MQTNIFKNVQKSRFSTVYWWMWNGFLTWWSNIHPWQTRAMCMTTNVFVYVIPNLYELILLNIFNPVPVYFIFFSYFLFAIMSTLSIKSKIWHSLGFFNTFYFKITIINTYKQTRTMLSRRFLKVHTQVKPGLYLYLPF